MKGTKRMNARKELVTYLAPSRNPFPPRFRTKFHTSITGFLGSGSGSGTYAIMMNGLYQPFNVSALMPSLTPFPNVSPIVTVNPTGYGNMVSAVGSTFGIYSAYRVYASSIRLQFIPGDPVDTIICAVYPQINQYYVGAANSSVLTEVPQPSGVSNGISMPYSKDKLFAANQQGAPIRSSIATHTLFGVTKRAIQDNAVDFTATYSDYPTNQGIWTVQWSTLGETELSVNCSYRVDMTYYVELFDEITPELLQ